MATPEQGRKAVARAVRSLAGLKAAGIRVVDGEDVAPPVRTFRAVAVSTSPYGSRFCGTVEAVRPSGTVEGSTYVADAEGRILTWETRAGAEEAARAILPRVVAAYAVPRYSVDGSGEATLPEIESANLDDPCPELYAALRALPLGGVYSFDLGAGGVSQWKRVR